MPEGHAAIQKDFNRLEKWAHANPMKFNKAKCKVLHLGRGNLKHKYRLSAECTESSPEEKDLGLLDDKELNMTWQCVPTAQKAKHILVSIPPAGQGRLFSTSTPLTWDPT